MAEGERKPFDGSIPVLQARGKSLAEAWENSLLELWENGGEAKTQYDAEGAPLSKDATMGIIVEEPSSEPFIHRAFPGGLDALEEYRQEVVNGIKDHWCRDLTNPLGDKWEYTYHGRLNAFPVPLGKTLEYRANLPPVAKEKMKEKGMKVLLDQPWVKVEIRPIRKYDLDENGNAVVVGVEEEPTLIIDQISGCIDALTETPYSRRIQAITWQPWEDTVSYDPACLQSIWMRMLPGDDGIHKLNWDVRFRSRDAYDAAFMNMHAFISLMEDVGNRISEKRGEKVLLGRYFDLSDSYHIYGRRREAFEDNFLKLVRERSFEDRTWPREFAQPFFDEAKPIIAKKVQDYDARN